MLLQYIQASQYVSTSHRILKLSWGLPRSWPVSPVWRGRKSKQRHVWIGTTYHRKRAQKPMYIAALLSYLIYNYVCIHNCVDCVCISYACLLTFPFSQIYKYEDDTPVDLDGPFKGRLTWNGSKDLQDVSIEIVNVTYNDSGIYECQVLRQFEFDFFKPSISITKNFTLSVKEKGAANFIPPPSTLFCSALCFGLVKCSCMFLWLYKWP